MCLSWFVVSPPAIYRGKWFTLRRGKSRPAGHVRFVFRFSRIGLDLSRQPPPGARAVAGACGPFAAVPLPGRPRPPRFRFRGAGLPFAGVPRCAFPPPPPARRSGPGALRGPRLSTSPRPGEGRAISGRGRAVRRGSRVPFLAGLRGRFARGGAPFGGGRFGFQRAGGAVALAAGRLPPNTRPIIPYFTVKTSIFFSSA